MPLNVLIIPDKFKGTLPAGAVAKAIATGWKRVRPEDAIEQLPMSDGGDGFGEVTSRLMGARKLTVRTMDAAHRRCRAGWWWEDENKTAIIESAAIIGLAMLPPRRFHPFELDTFGLGLVLRAAREKGARRCLVGIGGSATNDGGFGMARALGWEFLDTDNKVIEKWTGLKSLARLRPPHRRQWFRKLVVAVDVQNPLLGEKGATRIYGPQKGIRPKDFAKAEECLGQLAEVVEREAGKDVAKVPGAGAAGGLGFGLMAFAGARLEAGFELFAHQAKLERHLRWANLVITGEGAIDSSTLMGKGVGQIAHRCRELGIPSLGLAGQVSGGTRKAKAFTGLYGLSELTSVDKARRQPAQWLQRLAAKAATHCSLELRARRGKV